MPVRKIPGNLLGAEGGPSAADAPVHQRHANEKGKKITHRGKGQSNRGGIGKSDALPYFADGQGLSRPLVKPQGNQKTESGKKLKAEPTQQDHQQSSQDRLHGKGESLHQCHPGRALDHLCFYLVFPVVVVPGQSHGNKGNIEKMIGKGFDGGGFNTVNARVHEHQSQYTPDEAAWHQEALEEPDPGPQADAYQQEHRQEGEGQHAVKRERGIHGAFLIDLGLRKHIIDKGCEDFFPDLGRHGVEDAVDVGHCGWAGNRL